MVLSEVDAKPSRSKFVTQTEAARIVKAHQPDTVLTESNHQIGGLALLYPGSEGTRCSSRSQPRPMDGMFECSAVWRHHPGQAVICSMCGN